ncbi:MAG: hypothetical protein ACJA2Q_002468 [Pseudohongiellaceae bacterium]|jgi:hypothetical protein
MSKLVLSLDRGGIRGAATIQFLSHVEPLMQHQHKKSIINAPIFMQAPAPAVLLY